MAKIEAGSDVDAYCTKCKLVLSHVVIAVKAGRPARVECKTCGSVHAYKANAPGTRKKAKSRSTKTSGPGSYDAAMEGRDVSKARRYRVSESFNADEVIDHKKFGLGLITRVLGDDKVEVLFPDGAKVLVHNR